MMTEQTTYVDNVTVERAKEVPIRHAKAITGRPQAMICLHGFTKVAPKKKTLTERFNEAYDEEARQEDEEFVKHLKRYHRRRFSDEW